MDEPLHTIMTERLGCRWPIIQTAMGWVAEPSLVIGSCNAGAFGFLGAAVMTPDEAREKILQVRRGTCWRRKRLRLVAGHLGWWHVTLSLLAARDHQNLFYGGYPVLRLL